MNSRNGLIILLVLLSTASFALDCRSGGVGCALRDRQLKAINEAGIKPTQLVEMKKNDADGNESQNNRSKITAAEPFPIPRAKPYSYGTDSGTSSKNVPANQDASNSRKVNPILEMFAPKQQNASSDSSKVNSGEVATQPNVITYR